jgi:hypothetical protein
MGFFDPVEITSSRRKYTSAGVRYTNPITKLLEEAESVYGREQRVSCILSLGAGASSVTPGRADLSWLDVHGMLQAMESHQEQATANVHRQFGNLQTYFRFSVDNGVSSTLLRDWTHWESDGVEVHAREYVSKPHQSNELEAAIGVLVDRRGTTTLNRLSKHLLRIDLLFSGILLTIL